MITVDLSSRDNRNDFFPDFNSFEPFIKILTSVGDRLESISAPSGIPPNEVFKINDYNSTIEQDQFKDGMDFDYFIEYLTKQLSH